MVIPKLVWLYREWVSKLNRLADTKENDSQLSEKTVCKDIILSFQNMYHTKMSNT